MYRVACYQNGNRVFRFTTSNHQEAQAVILHAKGTDGIDLIDLYEVKAGLDTLSTRWSIVWPGSWQTLDL